MVVSGGYLRRQRERAGLSQRALGRAAGITAVRIGQIERKEEVTGSQLERYLGALATATVERERKWAGSQ